LAFQENKLSFQQKITEIYLFILNNLLPRGGNESRSFRLDEGETAGSREMMSFPEQKFRLVLQGEKK